MTRRRVRLVGLRVVSLVWLVLAAEVFVRLFRADDEDFSYLFVLAIATGSSIIEIVRGWNADADDRDDRLSEADQRAMDDAVLPGATVSHPRADGEGCDGPGRNGRSHRVGTAIYLLVLVGLVGCGVTLVIQGIGDASAADVLVGAAFSIATVALASFRFRRDLARSATRGEAFAAPAGRTRAYFTGRQS